MAENRLPGQLAPAVLSRVWAGDITYLPLVGGRWCYPFFGGAEQVAHICGSAQRLRTPSHGRHFGDAPGPPIQQRRATCARLNARHSLGLVLVDYLQLPRGDQKGNREQEVGSISWGWKELAREFLQLLGSKNALFSTANWPPIQGSVRATNI